MDVVRAGQRRAGLDPLHHRVLAAHHAVDVPVGRAALRRGGAERVHDAGQQRIGLALAGHRRGHVGRADEDDLRLRRDAAQEADLLADRFEVARDGLLRLEVRHAVAAVLQEDQPDVLLLVERAQLLAVHRGEDGAGRAAHRHVVHAHAGLAVQQDAVEVGAAGHGHRGARGAVGQLEAHEGERALAGRHLAAVALARHREGALYVTRHERHALEGAPPLVLAADRVIRQGGHGVQADEVGVGAVLADARPVRCVAVVEIAAQLRGAAAAHARGGVLAGRHHAGAVAAEALLEPLADRARDAVFLDLRVAVVDDAQRGLFRAVERGEQRVEEADVVVRQVEAGRVLLEEGLELMAPGGQLPLLDQLLRREAGAALRGGKDFGQLRETQPEDAPFGENGTDYRQGGDDTEQEYDDPGSFHASSFQTLRYSCRAHISSR